MMKTFGATLAIAGAASAAAIYPRQSSDAHCCFNIEVSGGSTNGVVGQLGDGQIRAGPGYSSSPAQFCFYNGTTTIVDGSGRGCLSTAPTGQLQCDAGLTANPSSGSTPGFSITPSGHIEYNGKESFYECNSGEGYNLYTSSPGSAATGCSAITVSIVNGNCSAPAAPSSSAPASSAPASSPPAYSAPMSSAPASSAAATTYACNPAHSYPGSTCISSGTGLTLVPAASTSHTTVVSTIKITSTATPVSSAKATSAPAPPPVPVSSAKASSAPAPPPASVASPSVCVPGTIIMPTETVTVTVTSSSAAAVSSPAASTKASTVAPSAAPSASSVTSGSVVPSAPAMAGACPKGLGNKYEYPHLIVPVDSSKPDTAYGTQYFGTINSTVSTIFNFDIPASTGTCTLEFLLPLKKDLETSDYTGEGGMIKVTELASVATQSTTYKNQPAVAKDLGTFDITPGSSTIIASGPCKAGAYSYELSAEGAAALHFFQDYNPSPIGLYVVEC